MTTAALQALANEDRARNQQLDRELTQFKANIGAARLWLLKSGPWLALHCAVGLGDLIAASATLGWSLLITGGND